MAVAGLEHFLRNVWFFNLNCCVVDMETLARNAVDARQNFRSAQAAVLSHHEGVARVRLRRAAQRLHRHAVVVAPRRGDGAARLKRQRERVAFDQSANVEDRLVIVGHRVSGGIGYRITIAAGPRNSGLKSGGTRDALSPA